MQTGNWKFVSGAHCLDFVNTVGGRAAGDVLRDKLMTYEDLVRWGEAAGTVENTKALVRRAYRNRRAAKAVLERARRMREALYALFSKRPPAAALAVLNRELRRSRQTLHRAGRSFKWRWSDASSLDCVLWPVARSAAELLASSDLPRVRHCAGENCGWLFLDTSRNGLRRWCDMRDCGNRAKVKRFRERRRAEQTSYSKTR